MGKPQNVPEYAYRIIKFIVKKIIKVDLLIFNTPILLCQAADEIGTGEKEKKLPKLHEVIC